MLGEGIFESLITSAFHQPYIFFAPIIGNQKHSISSCMSQRNNFNLQNSESKLTEVADA